MKKFISNKYVLTTLGVILLFLIWEVVSLCVGKPVSVFPDPIRTIKESFHVLQTSYFYLSLGTSFLKMLIGFSISLVLALIFGILAGNLKPLQIIFAPTITFLKAVPTAALVLLFLVLIGAKNTPILVVILISFPILYDAILGGYNNISKDYLDSLAMDRGSYALKNLRVKIPLSFPHIIVGISSSFSLAFKIEIMSEIVSGDTSYGLGVAIYLKQTQNASNMVPVFAYAFLAVSIMLILTALANIVKKHFTY